MKNEKRETQNDGDRLPILQFSFFLFHSSPAPPPRTGSFDNPPATATLLRQLGRRSCVARAVRATEDGDSSGSGRA